MDVAARSSLALHGSASIPAVPRDSRTRPEHRRHIPPIDGLRAVAVGAIVLFHFGIDPFSGGFVGVDVFFVISGFLITRILLSGIAEGTPWLAAFYRRRVLRIFPALFVMLGCSAVAALLLLYPTELKRYGDSLASVAGLGSNLFFRNSFGYFNSAADQKPLLHTWSLSVEEQFYLVYPAVVAVLSRRSRRFALAALILLFAVSLGASVYAASAWPTSAFYLAPYRFWELLLGGLIPLAGLGAPRSRVAREALATGGFGLILASVFVYTADTPFPGAAALVPCLGAAAVLLSCDTTHATGVARLLSLGPSVGLGRISYSLYLWHWPVLVFAGYVLARKPTGVETGMLVAFALALAGLSWRFVEQPARHRCGSASNRAVFAGAMAAMALTAACGGVMTLARGLPQRYSPEIRAIFDASTTAAQRVPPQYDCLDRQRFTAVGSEGCHVGAAISAEPNFIIWGDSLAANLVSPIAAAASQHGRSGLLTLFHSCSPLSGVDVLRAADCRTFNEETEALIAATPTLKTVILVSFWAAAISPLEARSGRADGTLRDAESGVLSHDENRRVFDRGLGRLVAGLRERGLDVVIVASVPEVGVDVPESLARRAQGWGGDVAPSRAAYLARQAEVFETFSILAERYGARVLYPHEILCRTGRCTLTARGQPIYFDRAHLNYFGAQELGPLFEHLF